APYAPSPQGAPQPPLPPQPARAPRPPKPPRPRGPGATTTGIVVGSSLSSGASLLVVDRQGESPWPVFSTWAGLSGILAGLAIVVSGLRGRTSGGLGWLAVVSLVVALPASAWRTTPFTVFVDDSVRTVTDGTHRITDPDVAEQGFGVSFGDPRIDSSDSDSSEATTGSPVEVPVRLGAGDATVVVPDGVPVRAEVQVLAGNARWHVDGDRQEIGGVSTQPVTFDNDEVQAGDDPSLVSQVEVGAGQNRRDDDTRPLGDESFDPAPAQDPEPAQQQGRREASGTDTTVPLPAVTPAADARATTPLPAATPSTDVGATTPSPAMPSTDPSSVDGPSVDTPPVGAPPAGTPPVGAPSVGAPRYGAAPTTSGADPSSTGGAPGALPRRGPRVATIVWGFVIVAFAVVVLAAALGARVDSGLATIVVLAAAGVTLVVGSIVSGARRRRG
ncbi:hypothetical protein OY671_006896, partial [Metschnikowia pulcherrima]